MSMRGIRKESNASCPWMWKSKTCLRRKESEPWLSMWESTPCPRIGESLRHVHEYESLTHVREQRSYVSHVWVCAESLHHVREREPSHVQIFESTGHLWEGMSLLGHVCEGWGEGVEERGDHVYPETVLDGAGKPERRRVFYRGFS